MYSLTCTHSHSLTHPSHSFDSLIRHHSLQCVCRCTVRKLLPPWTSHEKTKKSLQGKPKRGLNGNKCRVRARCHNCMPLHLAHVRMCIRVCLLGEKDRCTKQIRWAASLTPGIFTCVCRHRIYYGFSFMHHHESPRTPFDILYHRLSIPGLQPFNVYDNNCHVDRYCRAREPGLFANMKQRIDRLHYKGHCACCEGYDVNTYSR